jgi:hypothetical protein
MLVTLTTATREYLQTLNNDSHSEIGSDAHTALSLDNQSGNVVSIRHITEAKLLAHVTKVVDFVLQEKC